MSGFDNVISGVEHFPKHVLEWVEGNDSLIAAAFNPVLNEMVAYEKAHGPYQLKTAEDAGLAAFKASHTAGKTVGEALIAGVAAFFESGAAEIKTLSTQAVTSYLAGVAK